ncbi:MAG TPA: tyrosine-type recombinase/integrase [Thermomicrobiales bacterium]|nr:tyrosine-type recombinase/integrase [Thermomicrobiales bacterium]
MLVSDLIDEFLIDCRSRRLAPKTIAWYGANLRYFREWLAREGQADSLASFTLANGRRYSRWLSERTARRGTFLAQGGKRGAYALVETDGPLAANTAFGYLRTLKTFSRWLAAEEQGYTARDVLAGLKLPKRPKAREEPLTEEEMGRLLDGYDLRAPIANRDFAILLTYLGTGLRATELTNLLLDDVHVEEGYLRVRHGKGDKSRAVSLPPEVAMALFRYRQHHRPGTADAHFFVTRSGAPLTYNGIKCVLRRARRRSGIARLHTHLLRHSFSVAALRGGMDLMTLKETLGHEDIRTTSIYLSMSETQLLEQQRKVNPIAGVALPKAVRKAKGTAR